MGLDKKFLSTSYKRMSDQELLSIFSNDYSDLTEEAKEVLQEELTARGMGNGLDKAIQVQSEALSGDILLEYLKLLRNMDCPVCNGNGELLNALLISKPPYEDYIIACPECLEKKSASATGESIGLGVLNGFSGIVKGISNVALYSNLMKQIRANEPSDALIAFIKRRAGEIELSKHNPERLSKLLKHPNATIL